MHRKLTVKIGEFVEAPKSTRRTKKPLVVVTGPACFWVHEGPILSTLEDLCKALGAMSDAQYNHHVTRLKNDFSAWVESALLDAECAKELMHAKTRTEARKIVEESLKGYQHNG